MDSLKQGLNLLNYLFDKKRLVKVKENLTNIGNEDDDVKRERDLIKSDELHVSLLKFYSFRYH